MWVIAAGTSTSDSTPPSDSASVNSLRALGDRDRPVGAARRPRGGRQERDHPTEARVADLGDVVARPQELGDRRAFAWCRSTRRCSVRRPRSTRKQSSGPGTPPIAFWRKRSRSATASSDVTATPEDDVRMARRGTSSPSGTRCRHRASAAAGWPARRTCYRPRSAAAGRPRLRGASTVRATSAMSTVLSSGFVGDSNQTSRVRSDKRLPERVHPARSGRRTWNHVAAGRRTFWR